MAIITILGGLANVVSTTDKVSITTGTASATVQVGLSGKPTGNAEVFLYNDGVVGNSVPRIIPPSSKTDLYVGVGNQITVSGSGCATAFIGTASSADAGVYN